MLVLPFALSLLLAQQSTPHAPLMGVAERRMGVANGYALWLSDSSLEMRLSNGSTASMRFPHTPFSTSPDGTEARYQSVFPGIDLRVYRHADKFEYDWTVAPGVDPSAITVSFAGAASERIGPNGDLILQTAKGQFRHERPLAYQGAGANRRTVPVRFARDVNGAVRFQLAPWDRNQPLVIDPALSFSSGIGGTMPGIISRLPHSNNTVLTDAATSVALDGSGNVYIVGLASSLDFPLVNPLPVVSQCTANTSCQCPAVFAAKLSPDGQIIVYSTFLTAPTAAICYSSYPGGSPVQPAIAVDSAGNAYIAGSLPAQSAIPLVGLAAAIAHGPSDAFLVKLDPAGALKAITTFGGVGADAGTSIVLGADGKLYLAGLTSSADFPVTSGAFRTTISSAQDVDAFLMKMDPTLLTGNTLGKSVLYSTFLGQGGNPSVAADASGNAYISASTNSTAWPTGSGVFQRSCAGASCANVIVLKMNSTGNQLIFATYIGGSGTDTSGGIAVDGAGNLYITGTTSSLDFPITPGGLALLPPGEYSISPTAFVVKLSPNASKLAYSTLLTTTGGQTGNTIAVDQSGTAYFGGSSNSALQAVGAIQLTPITRVCPVYTPSGEIPSGLAYCQAGGYLVAMTPAGTTLWSTYLGWGAVNSVVLDNAGNAVVAGNQIAMRTTAASPSPANSASVVKIALGGTSLNLVVEEAAQFQVGLPAVGGLAALYVNGVTVSGTTLAPGLPLPTQLAGFTILVNGVAAPILAVAEMPGGTGAQVNFQVPFAVPNQANVFSNIVEVRFNGRFGFISPEQTNPGVFSVANGVAAIQHAADYSLVTSQNPAKPGETVIIYATGLGGLQTPVVSGTGAIAADPIFSCFFLFGGVQDSTFRSVNQILYAGATPGFPGLYQLNVQLSPSLPSGLNKIFLTGSDCWGAPDSPFSAGPDFGLYVR